MRARLAVAVLMPLIVLAPRARAQGGSKSSEVLTNQTVIQMVLAKLPKDVIQAKIQSSKTDFDVTVTGLSGLVANKVPTDIIKSMLTSGPKKSGSEVLTNESVIQMVTAKVPHDVIMAKIQATKTNFDVTASGLVNLNTNKVPKDVIKVMMAGS
ncbi:MAG: hypothetical protein ACREL5_00175 [Gemmatimonadales bacterium]